MVLRTGRYAFMEKNNIQKPLMISEGGVTTENIYGETLDAWSSPRFRNLYYNTIMKYPQIKVINYFTGEQVSIQDMFNYLAGLHLTDAIDYDTMALRAKTYTEFANMNMTYTNLAMHGNTLYV